MLQSVSQTVRSAGRESDRQAGSQSVRQTVRQVGRQSDIQTFRQTVSQSDSQNLSFLFVSLSVMIIFLIKAFSLGLF